jgi:hypothetical protein
MIITISPYSTSHGLLNGMLEFFYNGSLIDGFEDTIALKDRISWMSCVGV